LLRRQNSKTKIAKKSSLKECVFVNLVLEIRPWCQKYTPTDVVLTFWAGWESGFPLNWIELERNEVSISKRTVLRIGRSHYLHAAMVWIQLPSCSWNYQKSLSD